MQTPEKAVPYFPARLMSALAGIYSNPATVVSAPAGSGKTTAVRAFLELEQDVRVLWYTARMEPADLAWRRICALLREVDPETAGLLERLDFPVLETLPMLVDLMTRMNCDRETVLVLDNTHVLKSPISYDLVLAITQHSCANYHVVVITQTALAAPMFPLGAARALYLGGDLFFFGAEDIDAYFRLNGAELTEAQVRQVLENTFGWPAVVRLQLLGWRQTGEIRAESGIARLMRTALWEPLSPEEQFFLLAVSRMESVSRRQVCVLLGSDEIPDHAMRLMERGGFIQYDAARRVYTIHSLLRDFLVPYFDALPRAERDLLHARAGRAYLLEEMPLPAFQQFLLAGECEGMLAVPLTNMDMAEYGADEVMGLLRRLLAACPPELLLSHPIVLMRFAFEAMMHGERQLYAACCTIVARALKDPDAFSPKERRHLRGEYTFLRSFSIGNDLAKISAGHRAALQALEGPSNAFDTRWSWTFDVPSVLALYWSDHAPLAETLELVKQALPTYLELSRGHAAGAAELARAEAALNAGQPDDAEALCHRARYVAGEHCQDSVCFGVELTLGRIAVLRGDAAAYAASLEAIEKLTLTGGEKVRHRLADECTAFLQMDLGQTRDVPAWLQDEAEVRGRMSGGGVGFGLLLLGKYLLLKKDYNHLLGLAGPVLKMAEDLHMRLTQVYYLLYLACAQRGAGRAQEAQRHLEHALEIALPDGIYMPFAEHAAELAEPLAVWENTKGTVRRAATIRRLAKQHQAGAERINRKLYGAGLALTQREAEIAGYAKRGLSNKEIAEILFVSPETVKKTLKSVFSKLGLRSRRQLEDIELG